MDSLPQEVLERLLDLLDPQSLTRCRQLSRRLLSTVDGLLARDGYWRQVCGRSVPTDCLLELTQGRTELECADSANWKAIFVSWALTGAPGKFSPHTRELSLCQDPVTCLAVSGRLVVAGHASGSRRVWDTEQDGEGVVCGLRHQGYVSGLRLVDLLHRGPYHSGLGHHAFVTGGTDGQLLLSVLLDQYCPEYREEQEVRITLRRNRGPVLALYLLHDMLAVLRLGNTVVVWRLTAPATETRLPGVQCSMVLPGPQEQLSCLQLWPNKLVPGLVKLLALDSELQTRLLLLGEGVAVRWESVERCCLVRPVTREESLAIPSGVRRLRSGNMSDHSLEVVLVAEGHSEWVDTAKVVVAKSWVFHDNLFILLSTDHHLFISVDGAYYRHYHPLVELGAAVLTVAVHLNLLVFATEQSEVIIFHLEDAVEALQLDLGRPLWRGRVEGGVVKQVVLSEGAVGLVMVVVTDCGTSLTQWRSPGVASNQPRGKGLEDSLGFVLD